MPFEDRATHVILPNISWQRIVLRNIVDFDTHSVPALTRSLEEVEESVMASVECYEGSGTNLTAELMRPRDTKKSY